MKLAERMALVEKCSIDDVKNYFATVPVSEEYLREFAKPEMTGGWQKCLKCQELHNFRWGLAHGVGNCSCGWPARAYHYIDGKRVECILQYHPDVVEWRGKPKEVA